MENLPPSAPPAPRKKRRFRFWIERVLASAGAVTIGIICIIAGLFAVIPIGKRDRIVSIAPSPTGKYQAQKITYASGGAISPNCRDVILVVPVSEPDAAKQEARNEVFSAECDSFASHEGAPKIEWLSDDNLQITSSINSTAVTAKTVNLKKIDRSGSVRVNFIVHE
jgi:hypothetical protein